MPVCEHLGQSAGVTDTPYGLEPEYACDHPRHNSTTAVKCLLCPDYLAEKRVDSPIIPNQCPHPTGVIVDRYGRDAGVADLYWGASAFLLLGGPSVRSMPLELLSRRGVLLMSVNNCPAALPPGIRPQVWLHTDPARKFHDSIWRDPGILKFTPVREWRLGNGGKKALREKRDGQFRELEGVCARDMPGVFGFNRNTAFYPDKWLWEPEINRGNDQQHGPEGKDNNGYPNTINTMFAALRLAFYLGIKRLYLLGADFRMNPETPYAFAQGKSGGGVNANNRAFAVMCTMFDALLPHFAKAGYEVFNCTPDSGLWSFPYVPFEKAIEEVTQHLQQGALDVGHWYDGEPGRQDAE